MSEGELPDSMETYRRVEEAVFKWVRRAQLEKAIQFCERKLSKLPPSRYHAVIGRSWLSQTESAAQWLGRFLQSLDHPDGICAIYCEMNRFEINTDQWYVDGFAYDAIGDTEDVGWLCGWKHTTGDQNRLRLPGMEDLQKSFEQDSISDSLPADLNAASDLAILLLTLRMQELIHTAAQAARSESLLPDDLPVFSTAHDSDLLCISASEAGQRRLRKARALAKKEPPPLNVRGQDATGPGVYKMVGGWDANRNSLPWDVLDHNGEYNALDVLGKPGPLQSFPSNLQITLRKRKWRCDIIELYPIWVVTKRARDLLSPLLAETVQFLPLPAITEEEFFVLHPLFHVPLADDAITNANHVSQNITVVRRYSFDRSELAGKHIFRVRQSARSSAALAGYPCSGFFVSNEFVEAIEQSGLRGVQFEKVFSLSQE